MPTGTFDPNTLPCLCRPLCFLVLALLLSPVRGVAEESPSPKPQMESVRRPVSGSTTDGGTLFTLKLKTGKAFEMTLPVATSVPSSI